MRDIILITGGVRSGKSRYALQLAEDWAKERQSQALFLATCPPLDDDLRNRIRDHQAERDNQWWTTVEEETAIHDVLRERGDREVILLDCLTLWLGNLLHQEDNQLEEDDIRRRCEQLIALCRDQNGCLIIVTNEVGLGIVPDNALARFYRDLLGRANQTLAAAATRVTLMVAGLPLHVKSGRGR